MALCSLPARVARGGFFPVETRPLPFNLHGIRITSSGHAAERETIEDVMILDSNLCSGWLNRLHPEICAIEQTNLHANLCLLLFICDVIL